MPRFVGRVVFIHGKVVGRIWRRYYILHGNIEAPHFLLYRCNPSMELISVIIMFRYQYI